MPYQNQVLEGVQSRIKSRLDTDLQQDTEYKREQAKGLHDIIWSTNPAVTDAMRERAHTDLQKLYPGSKDLLGRIKDATGRVFQFLKAPPAVEQREKSASQQTLDQVTGATPPAQPAPAPVQQPVDAQNAEVYSGLLQPPPTATAQVGGAQVPVGTAPFVGPTATAPTGPTPLPPPLAPPPTLAQNAAQAAQVAFAHTKGETIETEGRKATAERESKRLEQERQSRLTKEEKTHELSETEKYAEHWAASGRFLTNQQTGEVREMESAEAAKRTADENNYRFYESQELGAGRKPISFREWMSEQAKAGMTETYQDVFIDDRMGVVKVPRSMMGLPREEIARKARAGEFQAAPRVVYSPEGMPSTGGQVGVSTTAPPTVPATAQADLADMSTAITLYERDIKPNLINSFSRLGPAMGRFTLAEIKAGGYSPDAKKIIGQMNPNDLRLATTMSTAMMAEAFANGGKQLTGTEKDFFEEIRPKISDTFETALIKSELAANFLRLKHDQRLEYMPVNQRRQMPGLGPPPTYVLDDAAAKKFLDAAGGDRAKAKEWIRMSGYTVPAVRK